ncbi:PLDc N-terminal domain-containing protein [Candidatus Stoquefichus sp. SB1]|uniref:PLDc N-terminal domain-containing protein n=1 Tax=Candidatus Stoquefichus sp. SB1 TaxID=1658109 RepID=UPI00067F1026|nr:PLD nuclease N-terminal domain-containing protein [Candidatus Stoquefichus sp. SB1]
MDTLIKYLPVLLPIIILELSLAIFSFIHVLRHPHYKFGNKIVWCIIVLFVQFIGPVVYFIFGRGED